MTPFEQAFLELGRRVKTIEAWESRIRALEADTFLRRDRIRKKEARLKILKGNKK